VRRHGGLRAETHPRLRAVGEDAWAARACAGASRAAAAAAAATAAWRAAAAAATAIPATTRKVPHHCGPFQKNGKRLL